MRQILRQREVQPDRWRHPGEDGTGPQLQTLAGLLALATPAASTVAELGVRLGPTDDVALLAPMIARLALIVVYFAASGDGRGYSQAQLLRQRYDYRGELRAAGAIRRDHLYLLARCGFDAFEFEPREDPRAALAHLERYSVAYQGSAGALVQPRQRP
jgi:uncharacterized protein (DUF934 family)